MKRSTWMKSKQPLNVCVSEWDKRVDQADCSSNKIVAMAKQFDLAVLQPINLKAIDRNWLVSSEQSC
jgi:hypothetical protein